VPARMLSQARSTTIRKRHHPQWMKPLRCTATWTATSRGVARACSEDPRLGMSRVETLRNEMQVTRYPNLDRQNQLCGVA